MENVSLAWKMNPESLIAHSIKNGSFFGGEIEVVNSITSLSFAIVVLVLNERVGVSFEEGVDDVAEDDQGVGEEF
jgi:hypothetical protein